ncbi:MAG: ATP-binding protein [Rhodospirillales bacterium]|nr:ATP-binding protein [Rhodospirillales bacterium]
MITEIQLVNWKSFEKGKLHIDPLTVLIGTNASGKSNALDALALLNRIASGTMLTSALQGDNALAALRGGLEWAARKSKNRFTLGVICRPKDEWTEYEYKIECHIRDKRCEVTSEQLVRTKYKQGRNEGKRIRIGTINLFKTDSCEATSPTITARLYNEKKGAPKPLSRNHALIYQLSALQLRQEITGGIQEVIKSMREIFILDPIPSHMRAYTPLSDKLDSDARNIAGVIAALPPPKQRQLVSTLSKYARKLPERDIKRVYTGTVGSFKSDAMLYCTESWEHDGRRRHTVDARGMSDGTLRFLAILTALLTRPKGSLLIVEEVDNGLHPSRARLLLDMLRSVGVKNGIDILVTTHNPSLLDTMGPEMVPFITVAHRDAKNGHSILTLLEDISQLPKLLAVGSIGKLSSQGLIEKSLTDSVSSRNRRGQSNG